MKIAIATKADWSQVSGHAGQITDWLVYDCQPGQALPEPQRIELTKAQLPHYFKDDGAQVLLTGETEPLTALKKVLAGEALADTRFDITTTLCKLRDLFSHH
jgi:hypothetical protein